MGKTTTQQKVGMALTVALLPVAAAGLAAVGVVYTAVALTAKATDAIKGRP